MMEAWQVNIKLLKETWFPKPLGREWEIKTFAPMLVRIRKDLNGRGIRFSVLVDSYDDVIAVYQQTLVDYVNFALGKTKPLGNALPTQTDVDTASARNAFNADPTMIDVSQEATRSSLTTGAKKVHTFLTTVLESFLLYMSKEIYEPEIKALVTKRL